MKDIHSEPHQEPATWILERLPRGLRTFIIKRRFPFMKIDVGGRTVKGETWYDKIPQGWRWSFGYSFCNDLREAFIQGGVNPKKMRIFIREKFGIMDVTLSDPCPEVVLDVLTKYAKLSGRTCIECGDKASGKTQAWILPDRKSVV